MIEYFSETLEFVHFNYTPGYQKQIDFVRLFEKYICYLEGSSIKISANNQIFKHFFKGKAEQIWSTTGGNP